jgi:hypothetical protein
MDRERGTTTGYAVIEGADPLNLKITTIGLLRHWPFPYGGQYPCGSLAYNGVWYYGSYSLDTPQTAKTDYRPVEDGRVLEALRRPGLFHQLAQPLHQRRRPDDVDVLFRPVGAEGEAQSGRLQLCPVPPRIPPRNDGAARCAQRKAMKGASLPIACLPRSDWAAADNITGRDWKSWGVDGQERRGHEEAP